MAAEQNTGTHEWIRGPLLGCGAYGTVSLALHQTTGQLFAVKSVDAERSLEHLQALENELELLQSVHSSRVVRCLGADWTFEGGLKRRNLKLEHMPGGSISDLMKSFGGKLEEVLIRQYTKGILEGLRDLHKAGIVHADVKGKNVLLGSSGVKLCDLGAAFRLGGSHAEEQPAAVPSAMSLHGKMLAWGSDRCQNMEAECLKPDQSGTEYLAPGSRSLSGRSLSNLNASKLRGTICWLAPEVVQRAEQGPSADIWSVGCTVIEMATGRTPWGDHARDAYSALYALGCTDTIPDFPAHLSAECLDFLAKCLQRDPSMRPSAVELLKHPFLRPARLAVPPVSAKCILSTSKPAPPAWSPTSVLANGPSPCSSDDTLSPPTNLRRTESEVATQATRGPHSHAHRGFPAMGSFPSFHLTTGDWPTPAQPAKPKMTVEIPSFELPGRADSTGESEYRSSSSGQWSWWSSPRSPTASAGQWITVHSTPSTPKDTSAASTPSPTSPPAHPKPAHFNFPAQGAIEIPEPLTVTVSLDCAPLSTLCPLAAIPAPDAQAVCHVAGQNTPTCSEVAIDDGQGDGESAEATATDPEAPAEDGHSEAHDGSQRTPGSHRLGFCLSFNRMLVNC